MDSAASDEVQVSGATRVVVAGGNELFRSGLRALLEREHAVDVVAESDTLTGLARAVHECAPDVAVIDAGSMPAGVDELLHAARRSRASTRCLVVSRSATSDSVQSAFEHGALGVIAHTARVDDLRTAIERLAVGDQYLHPSLGARMMRRDAAVKELTPREREIARQLALGHTNREIAGQQCLSPRTVETHRAHIMAKLRVRSRAELVRWALDSRLITAGGE